MTKPDSSKPNEAILQDLGRGVDEEVLRDLGGWVVPEPDLLPEDTDYVALTPPVAAADTGPVHMPISKASQKAGREGLAAAKDALAAIRDRRKAEEQARQDARDAALRAAAEQYSSRNKPA